MRYARETQGLPPRRAAHEIQYPHGEYVGRVEPCVHAQSPARLEPSDTGGCCEPNYSNGAGMRASRLRNRTNDARATGSCTPISDGSGQPSRAAGTTALLRASKPVRKLHLESDRQYRQYELPMNRVALWLIVIFPIATPVIALDEKETKSCYDVVHAENIGAIRINRCDGGTALLVRTILSKNKDGTTSYTYRWYPLADHAAEPSLISGGNPVTYYQNPKP
jgi:hypothetical protein